MISTTPQLLQTVIELSTNIGPAPQTFDIVLQILWLHYVTESFPSTVHLAYMKAARKVLPAIPIQTLPSSL